MKTAPILIVDDEPGMLEIFRVWLDGAGYSNVRAAGDGVEALELCRTLAFDLVISDINMPRMDGMTFLRNLRDLGQSMPAIVFISGRNVVERNELQGLDVSAFLLKPFRRLDLMTAVELALKERGRRVTGEPLIAA